MKKSYPYIYDLSNCLLKNFEIINYSHKAQFFIKDPLKNLFKTDIFYFNWPENDVKNLKRIILFMVFVFISKIFGKKIVWTHHNVHPHRFKRNLSTFFMNFLKKFSDYIIIHTKESYKLLGYKENNKRILYFFHPFFSQSIYTSDKENNKIYDLLIWGQVRRSKGLEDLLEFLKKENKLDSYRIKISGKFENDEYYSEIISNYQGKNLFIDNAFVNNEELDKLHQQSKYVFFSYTGTSVLNSGALITSMPKGTPIIGPNKGAFKEAGESGLIYTYNTFHDLYKYLDDFTPVYKTEEISDFMAVNSWEKFSLFLQEKLK